MFHLRPCPRFPTLLRSKFSHHDISSIKISAYCSNLQEVIIIYNITITSKKKNHPFVTSNIWDLKINCLQLSYKMSSIYHDPSKTHALRSMSFNLQDSLHFFLIINLLRDLVIYFAMPPHHLANDIHWCSSIFSLSFDFPIKQ